jgi:UPF0755 protein
MIRVVLAALVCLLFAGALGVYTQTQRMLAPAASEPAPQLFDVAPGATLGSVSTRLEAAGLVRSALATRLVARRTGLDTKLQVGEYEVSPDQTPQQILAVLTSGKVKTWPVTLPEGIRATEIAQRLEDAGLVEAAAFVQGVEDAALRRELGISGDSLEGYLYPDTYNLPRGMKPEQIARAMVHHFEQIWSQEIEALARDSSLSKAEIVTLASIVEKETAAEAERPVIAAVFLNRLDKNMRLETDPTVIYGIPDFDGNIKKKHLRDGTNPYNTYRIAGLPPGPIASPGLEALRAVVAPAETDFLYFVSRNDGTHAFSSTLRDHINAVNHYQKNRRNRQRAIEDRRGKLEAANHVQPEPPAPGI